MSYDKPPKGEFIKDTKIFEGEIEGLRRRGINPWPKEGDGFIAFMMAFAEEHRGKDVSPGTRDFLRAVRSFFRFGGRSRKRP
jgi:hypothetical protein